MFLLQLRHVSRSALDTDQWLIEQKQSFRQNRLIARINQLALWHAHARFQLINYASPGGSFDNHFRPREVKASTTILAGGRCYGTASRRRRKVVRFACAAQTLTSLGAAIRGTPDSPRMNHFLDNGNRKSPAPLICAVAGIFAEKTSGAASVGY